MKPAHSRYFLALVPSQEIQDYARQVQQEFSDRFASRAAFKSPPHITLFPPFEWSDQTRPDLAQGLQQFATAQTQIPVTLSGFAAFVPRVIYLNVLRSPELLTLHQTLLEHLEQELGLVDQVGKSRPFAPHLTVAYRDLTKENFRAAWPEFQTRLVEFKFTARALTLLRHNGQQWQIETEFLFLR